MPGCASRAVHCAAGTRSIAMRATSAGGMLRKRGIVMAVWSLATRVGFAGRAGTTAGRVLIGRL
jgi:hypothetical protein